MRQSPVRGQKPLDRPFVIAACLAGVTLAVYLRAIPQGFAHIDDPVYVNGNAHVLTGFSFQNLRWSFIGFHGGNWFPLTWLSLMLDAEIFGDRPAGYHFTNVALHVANTVLLFALLAQATGGLGKSAFVAALFALHPLHVESVAWISERKDVLSVFFGLLSLLAYVQYARRRKWGLWAISILLFLCSLMSKQTLVTLPFLLFLLDYWPLQRFKEWRDTTAVPYVPRLVLEKIPYFAVSGVFCVIAVFAQNRAIGTLTAFPVGLRSINAVVVYATYLRQAVVPYDLAVFYPYPQSIPLATALVAGLVLVVITAATLLGIRKLPFLFVGWAWYLGTLVPMVGIVQIGAKDGRPLHLLPFDRRVPGDYVVCRLRHQEHGPRRPAGCRGRRRGPRPAVGDDGRANWILGRQCRPLSAGPRIGPGQPRPDELARRDADLTRGH